MQIVVSSPKTLRGSIVLPASKSISNRALIINALTGNAILPENVSDCDDTMAMRRWLAGKPAIVDVGAAGTAMRFSTALLAVTDGEHVITGTERMKNRPIGVLVDALRKLGAEVTYIEKDGFPPLRIVGRTGLCGGILSLSGNVSSQYISALLMIGPTLTEGLRLTLTDAVVSRPYIDMTLAIMRDFGAQAAWLTDSVIDVRPGGYSSRPYLVESDWSAASYWYEIVALSADQNVRIVLPGLFADSLQGDSHGQEVFELLGVHTEHVDGAVRLTKQPRAVERLDYNFVEMPDLAQTFVVTCCLLNVPFHFTGLQSLRIKETDRIRALQVEMAKLGYVLEDRHDSELLWTGRRTESQPDVAIDTYDDHRMAMAFAPAALQLGTLRINHPEVVSKSYPRYWEDLGAVGFTVERRDQ